MSFSKSKINQIPNNANVIEEATRKLIPIAMEQKIKEKYLAEKETKEQVLKQMELRLKQKVAQEKRISFGLEDKALERIDSLVTFLSTLKPSTLSDIDSIYSKKASIHTQTDEDETSVLLSKVAILEKENEASQSKKDKYKKKLKLLQNENQELKSYSDKMQKENKMYQQTIEELMKIKSNQEQTITQSKKENSELQCTIQNTTKTINDLNQMKKAFEDKIQIEISKKKIEEKVRNDYLKANKCTFKILLVTHQLNDVIGYLTVKDICNFKLANKAISIEIANSNSIQRLFYTKVIDEKNKKINQLKNYEIKKEYLIQNAKLEQLIKEYAIMYKFPGKDLKGIIGKCINFLNKDVKIPLGFTPVRAKTNISNSNNNTMETGKMTPNPTQTSNNSNSGYGYLFGGFKSMFGMSTVQGNSGANESSINPSSGYHTPNPGGNSSVISTTVMKSQSNSRGMSFSSNLPNDQFQKSLEDYDKKLIDELNSNESLIQSLYEFDFQSADDIKMYLNKFLKSNFQVDKLTAFIKEVCSGYSELLFTANRSLYEIRELELVKNALNERYKYYYSQLNENKPEIKTAQRALTFSKGVNDNGSIQIIDHNDDNEDLDVKTLLKEKGINKQMMNNLELKSRLYQKKYEECKIDYDQFKNIFLKENRQLRFQVDLMFEEKNSLLKQIDDFNKFFDNIKNNEGEKENKTTIINN